MPKITTFLTFAENAEAAAELYVSTFERSQITGTTRYGGGPMAGQVMTVQFQLDGQDYVALNGGPHFKFSEGISLLVDCGSQEEVDRYSEQLTAGGGQQGPCGWLTDRFGVSWQIIPRVLMQLMSDPDPAKAGRVMQAMMGMTKIDVAGLERAYRA